MKKIITASIMALTISTANALSVQKYLAGSPHHIPHPTQEYNRGYRNGYNKGKQNARFEMGRTLAITGAVLIVGTMIYQLGKNSRWTTNENGITYRF